MKMKKRLFWILLALVLLGFIGYVSAQSYPPGITVPLPPQSPGTPANDGISAVPQPSQNPPANTTNTTTGGTTNTTNASSGQQTNITNTSGTSSNQNNTSTSGNQGNAGSGTSNAGTSGSTSGNQVGSLVTTQQSQSSGSGGNAQGSTQQGSADATQTSANTGTAAEQQTEESTVYSITSDEKETSSLPYLSPEGSSPNFWFYSVAALALVLCLLGAGIFMAQHHMFENMHDRLKIFELKHLFHKVAPVPPSAKNIVKIIPLQQKKQALDYSMEQIQQRQIDIIKSYLSRCYTMGVKFETAKKKLDGAGWPEEMIEKAVKGNEK